LRHHTALAKEHHVRHSIRDAIREKYAKAATKAAEGSSACCGISSCRNGEAQRDPVTADLYGSEVAGLPAEAVLASLGCGNPALLAELREGETVLDLGSGGGIDVLLSARRVGARGKAYGLDMTEEMLALADENKRKAGATNVEFLKGEIEAIPLPDASVDVIISNCVINLSADKERVLREAFRVLRPGGRLAVSDIVRRGDMPEKMARNVELWTGCVAGALEVGEYRRLLEKAGFESVEIEPTRVYGIEDARALLRNAGLDDGSLPREIDGAFMSGFVRAVKRG
jgi:SAM-dependent methyltransferase